MNLHKTFVREGITHIEDLSIAEFISAVENLKDRTVTEKLDGSNLWFGVDSRGFFTSREAKTKGKRFYSIDDYPLIASHNGFRGAHLALSRHVETIKKHLSDDDLVEVEVLFGSQPNTVNYGHTDKNFIVILRGIETDQKKVDALAHALNGKTSKVKSIEITSDDGNDLKQSEVEQTWELTQVKPVDVQDVDIDAAKQKLSELKTYLKQPNKKVAGKTNQEIAEISLTSVPKDVRDAVKAEREAQLKFILDNFKKPIKEILLDKLVRKVKPFLQSPILNPEDEIGVEGVVASDKKGNMIKIVDKDVWTAINKFNNQVRNDVSGLVKTDNQDAPIEMRGGAFGQAKIRIAELLGMKELALSSSTKKLITKFKGSNVEETVNNLAANVKLASFESGKEKVGAILKNALREIDDILGDFKQNAGSYKLKLGTGKEIGISPEIMKRNLTAFAETKRDINQVITAVLKSRDLPELLTALYGRTIQGLFSGDSEVKESNVGSFNLIKMLEDGEGGGEGGGDAPPAEVPMATSSANIAPMMFKLMGSKVITRRKRKFKKKRIHEAHKSLLHLVEFDTITQNNVHQAGVTDNIASKSDIEFKSLRNNLTVAGDELASSDVTRYLNKAHELNDEVDTVTFGMEMDDGSIIKVYVNQEHAEGFEQALAELLGQEDDAEEVIDQLAQQFDIVDVEWPDGELQSQENQEETTVRVDPQTGEDGQIGDGTNDANQEPQVEPIIQLGDDTVDDEAAETGDESLLSQIDSQADEVEDAQEPDLSTFDTEPESADQEQPVEPSAEEPDSTEEKSSVPADSDSDVDLGPPADAPVDAENETNAVEPTDSDDDPDPDPDPDNPDGTKKKKKKKSDDSDSDDEPPTPTPTKESHMSLGQRFKEKLLVEKAKPKVDAKKKEDVPEQEHGFPAGVQKLMNEFPNAGAKMMVGLLTVLGVPLDALLMKKADLKRSVESAAEQYMKDGQMRMWVKRLITSIQEGSAAPVQEAGLDKELSNSIQKMVFAVMQKVGLPESVEKLARSSVRNAVKALAAQVQADSKIRVNLKALAEILGVDVSSTAGIKEAVNHLGNKEYTSWASWKAAAKKAAAKAELGAVWFEGDIDIAEAFVGERPYVKGKTFSIGAWDGDKGDINQDDDLADTKKRMGKVTEAKTIKVKEPGWYVVDHMDKAVAGPFSEGDAHKKAKEMSGDVTGDIPKFDASYFSDYDIRRSLDEEVGETGIEKWVNTVKAIAAKLGIPEQNLTYRQNQVDLSIKQARTKIKNYALIQRRLDAMLNMIAEEVEGDALNEDEASDRVLADGIVKAVHAKLGELGVKASFASVSSFLMGGGNPFDKLLDQVIALGYDDGATSYEENSKFWKKLGVTKRSFNIIVRASN